jgi:hypothetical protein
MHCDLGVSRHLSGAVDIHTSPTEMLPSTAVVGQLSVVQCIVGNAAQPELVCFEQHVGPNAVRM